MATKPDTEKEDSSLPRKKAKVENEEPRITKSGDENTSTEHGAEADISPSNHQKSIKNHTKADDNNNITTSTTTTATTSSDKDNNNSQPSQPNSTTTTSSTTTTQENGNTTTKPYNKEDVVWEGNSISDLSWPTIPRFESWRLRDVSEGDRDFEKDLIDMFRSTTEEKLPSLADVLANQNKEESVLLSHDIKGSSSNIGAELLRLVAERMEHLSRADKFSEALECFPQLRKALTDTNEVFDKYFEQDS